ncbi:MAG: tRNA uridine-5-carboxymethylaminomethyl(34) synthesis GTPase MnmE [Proteobacteria bacterium]|nr:tRNA uridine-5-carboxymethylaminomethyl(34) synthesis GTPase MnmE [Pseudomonadota bacterium]MDA1323163.1 tRNA uridine-5-carboxymethylaminomethyl(34) synthesis GTPase MnmE [Pseudomonadota bacterium]
MVNDTIFAPATASGKAGIAVIRVSGPRAADALRHLTGMTNPAPRHACRCRLVDPEDGSGLDDGLTLWFPAPASFTGEDVVEFHLHGGRATVRAVCGALSRMAETRLAEPGEFTRRAFDNGKLDLTEIEGLADLIAAETEAQRKQALRQLGGALGAMLEDWRQKLLRTLALIEAEIDFPEEGLPAHLETEIKHNILGLRKKIGAYLDDKRRGELVRDGVFIAILGAPNVGKSSLLNALVRRDVAIVTETAGTTRDVLEVNFDLDGFAVTIADTAGLRETGDHIEREGVRRALKQADEADLRLVVFDASQSEHDPGSLALLDGNSMPVLNKIDTVKNRELPTKMGGFPVIPVSAKQASNMGALVDAVTRRVAELMEGRGSAPLTRTRHREALSECHGALRRAETAGAAELVAEDVRLAARSLGRITGRVDVEDVLDVIFREFCIGK